MFDVVTESLFGNAQVVRRLPNGDKKIFLTFDDGPSEHFTSQVLDVLDENSAQATFFMIATEAQKHSSLVRECISRGHAIGNHSYDHSYGPLFYKTERMKAWIARGEDILQQMSGSHTVGFRPPNGVVTPHLLRAAHDLNMPVYLWSCRFFDTLKTWRRTRALKALPSLKSGDILLLHDRQSEKSHTYFLESLRDFVREGKRLGWEFQALPKK